MNNYQTSLTAPSVAAQDTRPIRILRRWQVQDTVGLSRATIYQMVREGRFPKPVKIYRPQYLQLGWTLPGSAKRSVHPTDNHAVAF